MYYNTRTSIRIITRHLSAGHSTQCQLPRLLSYLQIHKKKIIEFTRLNLLYRVDRLSEGGRVIKTLLYLQLYDK